MSPEGSASRSLCGGRFQIVREVGAGGMGVVYAAWDHESQQWVAIKMLARLDAEGIYRIKREFRGLTEVRHPSLLALYELFEDVGRFFFTMELIDGEMLLDALASSKTNGVLDEPDYGTSLRSISPAVDLQRARELFHQVADALAFLHSLGKVHRDVKPENVLVDDEGRAVLLDFGIGVSHGIDGVLDTSAEQIMGTPAYMAPETLFASADARSDWYAFGVMLYEALVGELPFDRSLLTSVTETAETPVAPHVRVPTIPIDLSALAMDLLLADPAQRPTGAQVLERLAAGRGSAAPKRLRDPIAVTFVGRAHELARLRAALERVADEQPRVALLHGPSGIGKSALARAFLRECVEQEGTWLLSGSCYEHESLRFKAFDGVVDVLSRKLSALSLQEVAPLLPRRAAALVTVFPVLARVPWLGRKRRPERFELPADPVELRSLAFEALRDMLARIASRRRLVLYVDDLQWGDIDSAALLRTLVTGDRAPGMLVVFTYRSDDVETSPCLQAVMQLRAEAPALFEDVPLPPLSAADANALGQQLGPGLGAETLAHLSRDACGSPFLLTELVHHHRTSATGAARGGADPLDVATALGHRISLLSPAARELLDLISIAGRPLERAIYSAARERAGELRAAMLELRHARLVRMTGARGVLCPYHDRVREVVVEQIAAERRADQHARIARAIETQAKPDLDALVHHWLYAGDVRRASRYAQHAARSAVQRLAFERAVSLYRFALEHEDDVERRKTLRDELATALVLDGRRALAADVYLAGLEAMSDAEAANARQRAGQQLILSGHVKRGLELLRDALAGVGSPLESDLGSALRAWGVQHGRLVARGLHYEPRAPEAVPSAIAMRLDTLWAAGFGLNRVDGIRCYPALAQHLFEALESGDTLRVVRGLCMYHSIADYPTHLLGGTLLGARHAAQALAEQADDPFCDAWVLLADAFEHWFAGRPRSLQCFKDAALLLQERCVGAAPELGFTQQMILGHYLAVGAWDLVTVECQRFGTDATARNDRLYDYIFELEHVFRALLSGDPPAAQRALERVFVAVRERREEITFPVNFARGHVATAMGDVALLEQLLEWTRAFLQRPEARLPNFQVIMKLNEGRLAANIAAHSSGERRRTALEESDQALMAASAVGFEALGASVLLARAGVALAQGKRELAKAMLEATIARAPPYGGLIADLARYHHARLAGGTSADSALCEAERDLHARGVRDVGLLTAALAPLLAQTAQQLIGLRGGLY